MQLPSKYSAAKEGSEVSSLNSRTYSSHANACTYTLFVGFWDELAFAVDAGVGALASDALLPLRNVPGRRGTPACVLGTWARNKGSLDIYAH